MWTKTTNQEVYDFISDKDIVINCVQTSPIIVAEFKTRSGQLIAKSESNGYGESEYYWYNK